MVDDDRALEQLGRIGGGGQRFEGADVRLGNFWHSEELLVQPRSHVADVPPGLHIGCGIATIRSSSPDLGSMDFDGPGASAMLCPPGAMPFTSDLPAQTARSCGLFIAEDAVPEIDDPAIGRIVDILRQGAPLRMSTRIPAALVTRLCAPVDPWLTGPARQLAFEARTLDLTALTLGWLHDKPLDASLAGRHQRQAHAAREILEQRLADPPTLAELAREIGINVRALTDAFRATFGISIAAHVTERRLTLAAALLEQGMPSGEVARKIGYRPSHFSVAFRKRFGIGPHMLVGARHRPTITKDPATISVDIV